MTAKMTTQELIQKLQDYMHYAHSYGNAIGTCETGYPQHPGYICGMCGQDRSVERKCGRKIEESAS